MDDLSCFLAASTSLSLKVLLDFLGSLLSVTTAVLAAHYHRATWIFSLLAITINGCLYFHEKIWGHFFLDIFYACTALYGWNHWQKQDKPKALSFSDRIKVSAALALSTLLLLAALRLLAGHMVIVDAFGTSCALFAQILTALAYVEAWPLWLVHDFMNLIVDINRNLTFHFYKELFYFALAFYGFFKWKRLKKPLTSNAQ